MKIYTIFTSIITLELYRYLLHHNLAAAIAVLGLPVLSLILDQLNYWRWYLKVHRVEVIVRDWKVIESPQLVEIVEVYLRPGIVKGYLG